MNRDAVESLDKETLVRLVFSQAETIAALTRQLEMLTARVAELEAKLGLPPKTPDNSSTPPSHGHKPSEQSAVGSERTRDAKRDVTLIETANSATVAVVRGMQAEIGQATEPFVTQGIKQAIWGEPFYNVPKELGPYAYSTFNVRLDTVQKEPELVRGFVRGMVKGLKFLDTNKGESAEIAKKQFPTMPLDDLKATLDRSFADSMWSKDGLISRPAWDTAKAVVMGAGILKTDVKYEEIIDMSFVESVRTSL